MVEIVSIADFASEVTACSEKLTPQFVFFNRIFRLLGVQTSSSKDLDAQVIKITYQAAEILNTTKPEAANPSKQEYSLNKEFNRALQVLLKNIIPKLDHSPFDADHKMPKEIENYLSPHLKELREKKSNGLDNTEDKIARHWEKGEIARSFGYGILKLKGADKSVKITDMNGKALGLFKPNHKELSFVELIINIFKSSMGQKRYLSENVQTKAEQAVYFISSRLNFNLTASNSDQQLYEKKGCFQIWLGKEKVTKEKTTAIPAGENANDLDSKIKENTVAVKEDQRDNNSAGIAEKTTIVNQVRSAEEMIPRYEEAKNRIEELEKKTRYEEAEKTIFQKFAIFDYLIGNLDRHDENWLLIMHDNQLKAIKAIDNAHALPKEQPPMGSIAARKQYMWKELKISKELFTEETITFVKENLTKDKIAQTLQDLQVTYKDIFSDETVKILFMERWTMIWENLNNLEAKNNSPTLLIQSSFL